MPEKVSRNASVVVSPTQIQYSIVTSDEALFVNDFFSAAYSILKTYPKDLLQLQNPLNHFRLLNYTGIRRGLNLYTWPITKFDNIDLEYHTIFDEYSNTFNNDLVKIFLIDSRIIKHKNMADLIKKVRFGYFVFIGDPGIENRAHYDLSKSFTGVHELIKLIENDLPEINTIIEKEYDMKIEKFDFTVDPKAQQLNPYYPTLYASQNYFILNQILANYWLKKPREHKPEDFKLFNQDRVGIMLKQIEVIDRLHNAVKEKKPVTPIEPLLPPLVIIAPFHFPKFTKRRNEEFRNKKERMVFRVSQTEQNPDYTFSFDTSTIEYLKPDQIAEIIKILSERLILLSDIGYLHAQLTNSPLYRLPVVGKSLNMHLSHFQNGFSNKKNAILKIDKIGKLMKDKMIPDRLAELLKKRNGQLVFISDLPMEWLKINKYPLLLTHDICRIPQFNHNSLLNNYIRNQRFFFRISPDILKKTLIIHCADQTDLTMQKIFKIFDERQEALGFTSIICKSVEEISNAVKFHKPELLIFDCHGNFNEKDLSSYLVINDKKNILLTGEDIIKHKISAPLVFISACSTMPNYGYVKFLSDAFFQAGAFSVTATFLPIKMIDAAVLLIRLLNNLKQQQTNTIFSNWLAFISHTLRSVLIFETFKKERIRNNLSENFDEKKISEFLLELMDFSTRENAFENLQTYLKTINPSVNTLFENLEHEWLSYTTIGRADLIYFEKWLHEHQMENFGSTH